MMIGALSRFCLLNYYFHVIHSMMRSINSRHSQFSIFFYVLTVIFINMNILIGIAFKHQKTFINSKSTYIFLKSLNFVLRKISVNSSFFVKIRIQLSVKLLFVFSRCQLLNAHNFVRVTQINLLSNVCINLESFLTYTHHVPHNCRYFKF